VPEVHGQQLRLEVLYVVDGEGTAVRVPADYTIIAGVREDVPKAVGEG
jgi:hypothetical protein